MNAGQCVIHAFLFSALSPLGLSVSPGLGLKRMWLFMRRSLKRIHVRAPSHRAQFSSVLGPGTTY